MEGVEGVGVCISGGGAQGVQLPIDEWGVWAGDTRCVFDFTLYEWKEQKASAKREVKEGAAKKGDASVIEE